MSASPSPSPASIPSSSAQPAARLLVLAKEPRPGRVKTRLCPPCTPGDAARVAAAALADTVDAVLAATARLADDGLPTEPVLVLDGSYPPDLPVLRCVPQVVGGLDERLAAAFAEGGRPGQPGRPPVPTVLIGMDTPQVTADLLADAVRGIAGPGPSSACLGLAVDGGWWLLGLGSPDPALLRGLPMSTPETGAATSARLRAAGLDVLSLPVLRDVDTVDDAELVARQTPGTRFAATWASTRRVAS